MLTGTKASSSDELQQSSTTPASGAMKENPGQFEYNSSTPGKAEVSPDSINVVSAAPSVEAPSRRQLENAVLGQADLPQSRRDIWPAPRSSTAPTAVDKTAIAHGHKGPNPPPPHGKDQHPAHQAPQSSPGREPPSSTLSAAGSGEKNDGGQEEPNPRPPPGKAPSSSTSRTSEPTSVDESRLHKAISTNTISQHEKKGNERGRVARILWVGTWGVPLAALAYFAFKAILHFLFTDEMKYEQDLQCVLFGCPY